MGKTIHIDSKRRRSLDKALEAVRDAAGSLLEGGADVAITVVDEQEEISPQEAGERLGFSRQHVYRLIDAGVLDAHQLPDSSHWKIPLRSVLHLEEQRAGARERADELSRQLDELGAPLE